jgi:dTDP-L-rhamnose 4-epimerase
MQMKILVTGGAGFIGSRLVRHLAGNGRQVTVLDNLSPQIHGPAAEFSAVLKSQANCVKGSVCDAPLLEELLHRTDAVVHLAAETGTGQSMYAIEHYSHVNIQGTATLLDIVVNKKPAALKKIIVASSRAIYGEGEYRCSEHGRVFPETRENGAMLAGQFEPVCPVCGRVVAMAPTKEDAQLRPSSFYGLTKLVQEKMTLMFAQALGIDGFALRYQNVYGPGQSLTNPYTGILAIFSNLVRQGHGLNIFEDGRESRDFVYIDDVVAATAACAGEQVHGVMALNVGSGVRTDVLTVAEAIKSYYHADVSIQVSGAFRVGDIRHNIADISRIRQLVGYEPQWTFERGLKQFLDWAESFAAADVGFDRSLQEMKERGLMMTGRAKN